MPHPASLTRALFVLGLAGLAHQPPATLADAQPAVNSRAYDRGVWHELLQEHASIRRSVIFTTDGVEATTESDDPAVAAKIIDHAKAMQARMQSGAQVRVWDPVFQELFERHHTITIDVTPTSSGVRIVERSDDAESVSLLWSHAAGVSEFVRVGFDAAPRATPRIPPGSAPPASELAIGGVRHRFLLSQPQPEQLEAIRAAGVTTIINFRHGSEYDVDAHRAAAKQAGITYCSLPYATPGQLTDEMIDTARAELREADAQGRTVALVCRTGNRIGPNWIAARVLDQGVPIQQAVREAHAMRMVNPLLESIARAYVRRHADGSSNVWNPIAPQAMGDAQEARFRLAVAARDDMFNRLFAALAEAVAADGAAGAIGVCKDQAPRIATAVSRDHGLMIGRTSGRTRNPANIAPPWALGALQQHPVEPVAFANTDGSLGVLMPIRMMSTCLACHGEPDVMQPDVRAALAKSYPNDTATGYREGDLRGWFWIELPPAH